MYADTYEFVESQIALHGEDYVWELSQRGYVARLTDRGWRWILTNHRTQSNLAYALDNHGRAC